MGVKRSFHRANFKTQSYFRRPRASGDLIGGEESGFGKCFSEVPACAWTTVRDGVDPNPTNEKGRP